MFTLPPAPITAWPRKSIRPSGYKTCPIKITNGFSNEIKMAEQEDNEYGYGFSEITSVEGEWSNDKSRGTSVS